MGKSHTSLGEPFIETSRFAWFPFFLRWKLNCRPSVEKLKGCMIGPRGCMKATEISILGPQRVDLAFPNWIEDLNRHLFESLKSDLIYLFRSCVFSPPFFRLGLLGRWRVMISKTWDGCLGDKCVLFHPNNICVCSTTAAEKYTNSAIYYTV